jgi:succinyl-CoA synthetase beta subunit
LTNQVKEILPKLYQCFITTDSTLLEINPMGVSIEGKILVCDNKINIDDNSSHRQQEIFMM